MPYGISMNKGHVSVQYVNIYTIRWICLIETKCI